MWEGYQGAFTHGELLLTHDVIEERQQSCKDRGEHHIDAAPDKPEWAHVPHPQRPQWHLDCHAQDGCVWEHGIAEALKCIEAWLRPDLHPHDVITLASYH